jgi:hypothetical protein
MAGMRRVVLCAGASTDILAWLMAMGCRILPGGKLSQSVVPLWKVIVGNLSTKLRRAPIGPAFFFFGFGFANIAC